MKPELDIYVGYPDSFEIAEIIDDFYPELECHAVDMYVRMEADTFQAFAPALAIIDNYQRFGKP